MTRDGTDLMKNKLAHLEARLQALIEGSAARLFSSSSQREDLAARLVAAMQANIHTQADGSLWAPNLYTLIVHPAQAQALLENHALLQEMAQTIYQNGTEAGLRFPSPPVIKVTADPGASSSLRSGLDNLQIQALFNLEHLVETSDMESQAADYFPPRSTDAFLIVDGARVYPLDGSVVNIGRSSENQLVLDDLRVSRAHAQLRFINGKYVIFDLGSTGGTSINGQRVIQSALHPGDVISLAGVPIIFGQDQPRVKGETQPYNPEMDDMAGSHQ